MERRHQVVRRLGLRSIGIFNSLTINVAEESSSGSSFDSFGSPSSQSEVLIQDLLILLILILIYSCFGLGTATNTLVSGQLSLTVHMIRPLWAFVALHAIASSRR